MSDLFTPTPPPSDASDRHTRLRAAGWAQMLGQSKRPNGYWTKDGRTRSEDDALREIESPPDLDAQEGD